MLPYGVTRPQWVKDKIWEGMHKKFVNTSDVDDSANNAKVLA